MSLIGCVQNERGQHQTNSQHLSLESFTPSLFSSTHCLSSSLTSLRIPPSPFPLSYLIPSHSSLSSSLVLSQPPFLSFLRMSHSSFLSPHSSLVLLLYLLRTKQSHSGEISRDSGSAFPLGDSRPAPFERNMSQPHTPTQSSRSMGISVANMSLIRDRGSGGSGADSSEKECDTKGHTLRSQDNPPASGTFLLVLPIPQSVPSCVVDGVEWVQLHDPESLRSFWFCESTSATRWTRPGFASDRAVWDNRANTGTGTGVGTGLQSVSVVK